MSRTTWSAALVVIVASASGCIAEAGEEVGSVEEALGHYPRGHRDRLVRQDHPIGAWLYQHLAVDWLRWMMGQPFSTGPVTDPTGASCGLDQHGPVFYLAGTTGGPATRECDIPRNKALFFPLINSWLIPYAEEVDEPGEMEELIAFAEEYFPYNRATTCTLTLRLDGEEVLADTAERDEELWTDVYDPFPIFLDDDNYYSPDPGGEYPAALTAGHFALFKPLSRGHHTLELGGVRCDGEEILFETAVTYDLNVH